MWATKRVLEAVQCVVIIIGGSFAAIAIVRADPKPTPTTTSQTPEHCVDASGIAPAQRDEFVRIVAEFFRDAPCWSEIPRVITRPMSDDMSQHDRCERGKRLINEIPNDSIRLVLSNCARRDAIRFAEEQWRELEERGAYAAASRLAAELGLDGEADRLLALPESVRPGDSMGLMRSLPATLEVRVIPWEWVLVDGKSVGDSPSKLEVTAGHHVITLKRDGVMERTFPVDLKPGERKIFKVDLRDERTGSRE